MDGVVTGEAPQLSCNNPANTQTGCAAGQYGKYDNGKNVFSFYSNFKTPHHLITGTLLLNVKQPTME